MFNSVYIDFICILLSYNKFTKLQPFIIAFVCVSATAAAFVGMTVYQV